MSFSVHIYLIEKKCKTMKSILFWNELLVCIKKSNLQWHYWSVLDKKGEWEILSLRELYDKKRQRE